MADTAAESTPSSVIAAEGSGHRDLMSTSFVGLLAMQLLTAVNDNIFRWLAIGIGKQYVQPNQISYVLTAGTAAFVLPYLLLAAPSGYLADRFSKRTVIVVCKFAEIILMALGVLAIWVGNFWLLFAIVALMGGQSALFSPAKLGSIPEMLKSNKIPAANGLMGLTTVIATIVGSALGNVLSDATGHKGQDRLWISALVLLGVACVGWLFSLLIARLPAAAPTRHFPWDAGPQTIRDLRTLGQNRALLRVALGVMFFWSLGVLAQLNIDQFAFEGGATKQSQIIPLLLALVLGVGLGSVLAGVWSGGRVELGILPLGAGGIALASMLLFTVPGQLIVPDADLQRTLDFALLGRDFHLALPPFTGSYIWACTLLFGLGISAGLFDVPLSSYMQHRSPPESRGSILAASNFMTFSGTLVMSFVFSGLRAPIHNGQPLLTSNEIFLLCGLFTIPVFSYIVWLIPQASIRFFVWLASKTVYRIRVYGHEHLPPHGGAVLVPNHVSYLDAALLLLTSSRPIRILAWAGNFENRWMKAIGNLFGAILVNPARPKAIVAALREAREAVLAGELVCVFPEGGISRSGQVLAFRPGVMRILEGTNAPVIPVYLDGVWGSIFSFERGRFFWKWPKKWPYPISIHIGPPITAPDDVHQMRQAVLELGANAVRERSQHDVHLLQDFVRQCKRRRRRLKVADSMGNELSGADLLIRTLILRRLLRRHVLAPDEKYVGVLLPPSTGGVTVNAALALDRRISANLNYTATSDVINACIQQSGIKHVLTSRQFMSKMNFQLNTELVYLEDFKTKVTLTDKILAGACTYTVPASILNGLLGLGATRGDDVLTVIFTSGSTGTPKGVLLTHANVSHNVHAIEQVVRLTPKDVLLGILPFFHSFGYTVTLWTPLGLDVSGAYHYSPLDARQIAKLCRKYHGTVLLSTPTFLRSYVRRIEKGDFATLDVVVTGAEKLPRDVADAFEEKFGVRPSEGYGTTELSPLVSVNVPPSRSQGNFQTEAKEGTVGRPVPAVSAKVTDLDTGAELPAGKPGMLWIKGPNVMQGYLNLPKLTAEVIRDGWYNTGDVAFIDDEGFITITGRESRFSKIGGEMVPHILIEEAINKIVGLGDDGEMKAAVTAVPHAKKGERLVVIHMAMSLTPDEVCKKLIEANLPNLYIPSPDSFVQVERLPILGSGKLDLKAVKQIACDKFGGAT